MEEKTRKYLNEWAARVGRPVSELEREFLQAYEEYKKLLPGKTESFYEDVARRKVYLNVKAELTSPARPYDFVVLGYSPKIDATAGDRAEKLALYNNPATRAQAIAEGKVSAEGVPLDSRPWIIPPDPSRGIAGRKNPRYGKPLEQRFFRNVVGFGRPASGGKLKLVYIMASREPAELEPPIGKVVRARLNLRKETEYMYVCNSSVRTKYEPSSLPELEPLNDAKICELLASAPVFDKATNPSGIAVPLSQLHDYHELHADDPRRLCIFSGDVTRINREPTAFGSILLIIEDTSMLDLESEGTPVWIPQTLEHQLDFGVGSRVYGIARTTVGPGFNRETGQLDSAIERIQLNAFAIFADPAFRVPPEEESVIEGEVVQ